MYNTENKHIYKITAKGGFIMPDKVAKAVADLGLEVTGVSIGYSLSQYLTFLPAVVPGLGAACAAALSGEDDYPDGWDSYHYVDKVIAVCDTDVVSTLASSILKQILPHEDEFTAEELTTDLLMYCKTL